MHNIHRVFGTAEAQVLTEPMTLATDYALAAANAYFGLRLRSPTSRARRYWAAGFIALAVSAFLGGTVHGFAATLQPKSLVVLWQITELAIGAGAWLLLLGIAHAALQPGARRWLVAFATAQLMLYAAFAAWIDDYVLQIADTGAAMLIILAISLAGLRAGEPWARWLAAGIAVSALAAGVQAAGLAPHRNFNHNDLYHVIQIFGMYLFYRGGLLFDGRTALAGNKK